MLADNFRYALFGGRYFLQALRVVFKDPEDSVDGVRHSEKAPDSIPEEKIVESVRTDIPVIDDNEHYTFGRPFNLSEELKNGNISEKAGEFVRQWPVAKEALKSLYEYDAYTYIHTVQMLNEGVGIIDENFEELKRIVESGKVGEADVRFNLTDTDLKIVFFGAIVFHDWGKTRVDRGILNYPGRLSPFKTKEMQKHVMGTVDIVISKIIDRIYPNIGIKGFIDENRILREANNETKDILIEMDKLIKRKKY